jgi:multidrug resistance efflux pump
VTRWPMLLVLLSMMLVAGLSLRVAAPPPPRAELARHVVAARTVAPEVVIAGRLEWDTSAIIHAPADGTLRAVMARPFEMVQPGQQLLVVHAPALDDDLGRARLAVLQTRLLLRQHDAGATSPEMLHQRAALAEVDAQIGQARRRAETAHALVAGGIAPRQELVELNARVEELQTRRVFLQQLLEELERRRSPEARAVVEDQIALAESTLRRLEAAAAELEVRSPVAGRFLLASSASGAGDQLRQVGEAVRRGERIATIADPSRLILIARADEADALRIRAGARATAAVNQGEQVSLQAVVREVRRLPRASGAQGVMEEHVATIDILGSAELQPGLLTVARVDTPPRMAIIVPLRFVQTAGGRGEVRRTDTATGAVDVVAVSLGAVIGEGVEVIAGLAPGDVLLEIR